MQVLSRKPGEDIVTQDGLIITVLSVHGNKVRLGMLDPRHQARPCEEVSTRHFDETELTEIAAAG
jgi:carbon storage regulator CsrA